MKMIVSKNKAVAVSVAFLMLSSSALLSSCSKSAKYAKKAKFESSMLLNDTASLGKSYDAVAEDSIEARKFIRTAYVNYEIPSLDSTDELISEYVKTFGGFISDSSSNKDSCSYTVKIPSSEFEKALTYSDGFGKITSKSIYNDDVTDRYYDLETRLNTKKVMKEKLESYLSKAKDMKELLEVEKQLNQVVSDLEVMQGQMNRLSKQIDYATFNISFSLPASKSSTGYSWGGVGDALTTAFAGFGIFLGYVGVGLIYLVIFGVPIVALFALFYWLLFGKIGLLVKLFRKLKG